MRSRPDTGCANSENSGRVRRTIQAMLIRRMSRVPNAPRRPSRRARGCWALGSFPARIEMKMMLSIPRTTSSTVSVRSPTHALGSVSQST
jgi:hypothetical protein